MEMFLELNGHRKLSCTDQSLWACLCLILQEGRTVNHSHFFPHRVGRRLPWTVPLCPWKMVVNQEVVWVAWLTLICRWLEGSFHTSWGLEFITNAPGFFLAHEDHREMNSRKTYSLSFQNDFQPLKIHNLKRLESMYSPLREYKQLTFLSGRNKRWKKPQLQSAPWV